MFYFLSGNRKSGEEGLKIFSPRKWSRGTDIDFLKSVTRCDIKDSGNLPLQVHSTAMILICVLVIEWPLGIQAGGKGHHSQVHITIHRWHMGL